MNTFHSYAHVFSEPITVKLSPAHDLLKGLVSNKNFISSEVLADWVKTVSKEFGGPRAGQIFRGLGVVSIPALPL